MACVAQIIFTKSKHYITQVIFIKKFTTVIFTIWFYIACFFINLLTHTLSKAAFNFFILFQSLLVNCNLPYMATAVRTCFTTGTFESFKIIRIIITHYVSPLFFIKTGIQYFLSKK